MNLSKLISKKDELKLALASISFIDEGFVCLECTGCSGICSDTCSYNCYNTCASDCTSDCVNLYTEK